MTRLYAVKQEDKSPRQMAREAVQKHRAQSVAISGGSFIGESYNHCIWLPAIFRAFLAAEVIKPEPGEIQRRLYG